jgi:hypothetical protein
MYTQMMRNSTKRMSDDNRKKETKQLKGKKGTQKLLNLYMKTNLSLCKKKYFLIMKRNRNFHFHVVPSLLYTSIQSPIYLSLIEKIAKLHLKYMIQHEHHINAHKYLNTDIPFLIFPLSLFRFDN